MFLLSIFGKSRTTSQPAKSSQHQRGLRPGDKERLLYKDLPRSHEAAPVSTSNGRYYKDRRRWQDGPTDEKIGWQQRFIPRKKELEELHPALRTRVSFLLTVDQIFED